MNIGLPLAVVLLYCTGCSKEPVNNPHPTRVVRIFGAIDRSLSIKVKTLYQSTACGIRSDDWVAGWIEGVSTPRSIWAESRLQKVGDVYQAYVAMDLFIDDKCHWYPKAVGFQISNRENLTTGEHNLFYGYVTGPVRVLRIASLWFEPGTENAAMFPEHQTIECQRKTEGGEPSLECANKEHLDTVIDVSAREIQVDVRDLSGGT